MTKVKKGPLWSVRLRKVEIDVIEQLIQWSKEDHEIPEGLKEAEFIERRDSALLKLKAARKLPIQRCQA